MSTGFQISSRGFRSRIRRSFAAGAELVAGVAVQPSQAPLRTGAWRPSLCSPRAVCRSQARSPLSALKAYEASAALSVSRSFAWAGSLAAAVLLTRKREDVAKKLWLLALRRDSRRRFLDRAPSSPSPGPRVVMHARQLFWTAASAKSVATAWVQVSQTHHPGLAAQQANVTFGVLTLGVWQLWAIASLQMERLRLAAPRTSDGSGQEG